MNRFIKAVAVLAVVACPFVGQAQVVFQDDFTGTTIDTTKWDVVEFAAGSIIQDGTQMVLNGGGWDNDYVTTVPEIAPVSGAKVLQVSWDTPDGYYFLAGFYEGGTAFGGFSTQIYGCHWNPKCYAMEGGNDWTHTDDVSRPAPISFRMTFGPTNGCLWEYDYQGSGWTEWRDTREEGTGQDHPATYHFYYMSNAVRLRLDNVVMEYVDHVQPPQWTVTGIEHWWDQY